MRKSVESNRIDKSWHLFTTIEETDRSIIQEYNRMRYAGSLETKIMLGEVPISIEAMRTWENLQEEKDLFITGSP